MQDFLKTCKYLLGEEAPYDMNETAEDSPFYKPAKSLADEMGIDWKKMTHEESNRLVVNMLSDAYLAIRTDDEYMPVLSIGFQKVKR